MPGNNVPTLHDLMNMMDVAERSIDTDVGEITETTERMCKKGNGHDPSGVHVVEADKTHKNNHGILSRVRRKFDGIKQ